MDYLEGALDVDTDSILASYVEHMGKPEENPHGDKNKKGHVADMFMDASFYALSAENDKCQRFVNRYLKYRRYVVKRRDCDNRAILGLADLWNAADDMFWGANPAVSVIWYDSKTLTEDEGIRFGGYHAALAVSEFRRDAGKLDLHIVQPPLITENGNFVAPKWQRPEDEVKFWVGALAA